MSGLADYTPVAVARSFDLAERCSKLASLLTREEIEQYQFELRRGGIPCRTCEKDAVPVNRCSDPIQGPFTYLVKCSRCPRFVLGTVAEIAAVTETVGGGVLADKSGDDSLTSALGTGSHGEPASSLQDDKVQL